MIQPAANGRCGRERGGHGQQADRLFWRVYAAVYDTVWDHGLTRDLAQAVAGQLAPGTPVVEVGAGTGLITRHLVGPAVRVRATEPNRHMRRRLESRSLTADVVAAGIEELAAGERPCTVVAVNVLHLVDAAAMVPHLVRVAGVGGRLIVATPCPGVVGGEVAAAIWRRDSIWRAACFVGLHQLLVPLTWFAGTALRPGDTSILDLVAATPGLTDGVVIVSGMTHIGVYDVRDRDREKAVADR